MKPAEEEPTISQTNYDTLFQDKEEKVEKDNEDILNYIETFTLSGSVQYPLPNAHLFWNQITKAYTLELPKEKYKFYKLSDFMRLPKLAEIIKTNDRYRQCHHLILDIIELNYNFEAVTGYIYIQGRRTLHSVAKTTFLGEEVYLDVTGNIIMPVEDYERLFHFQIISTLTQDEYIEFSKRLAPYFDTLSEKMILTVMGDLAKDIEKRPLSKH